MDEFFKCNLFTTDYDLSKNGVFVYSQKELLFKDYQKNGRASFAPVKVKYKIQTFLSKDISLDKVPLIIPIKGMSELLDYTLKNLFINKVNNYTNIFVIDDRTEDTKIIKSVTDKYNGVSYVRVDNSKGFSYSTLANVGAHIAKCFNFDEIIYWNSDLWVPDSSTVPELINKHRKDNCCISGTKLVYPTIDWKSGEVVADKHKIQFGGSYFDKNSTSGFYEVRHFRRFADVDDHLVNHDCGSIFVTGAYSMMNLEWLIEQGGFNCSLSKVYNDVDICLRANSDKKRVMYYGKDVYLIHGESINLNNSSENKFNHQFNSDYILYHKLYPTPTITKLLGIDG